MELIYQEQQSYRFTNQIEHLPEQLPYNLGKARKEKTKQRNQKKKRMA